MIKYSVLGAAQRCSQPCAVDVTPRVCRAGKYSEMTKRKKARILLPASATDHSFKPAS